METYNEYPIRCKTCNEQIAARSYEFVELLNSGYSIENALNLMEIFNYCSRIALITPTIVAFNMEQRDLIEGRTGSEVFHNDIMKFDTCSDTSIMADQGAKFAPIARKPVVKKPLSVPSPKVLRPEPEELGIELEVTEVVKFKIPISVGIPSINTDSTIQSQSVYVGAGKNIEIINGRTYLAR